MKSDAMLRIGCVMAILFMLTATGCTDVGVVKDEPGSEFRWDGIGLNETGATEGGVSEVAQGLNRFGFDMYLELLNGNENVFISPYSIYAALAMTYEGARGATASQMASILNFPGNETLRRASFARIQNLINGTDDYELSSPNRIWPQEGYPVQDSFLNVIEQYYYGGIQDLDYYRDPEGSRRTINQWVEDQTNDRIKDLIPEGVIDPTTVMVLTNAIYFLGKWLYQFNEDETEEADFTLSSGSRVKAPMMGMKVEDGLDHYEDDDIQAIELPYKGEDLSMMVLLPKDGDIDGMAEDLGAEGIRDIIDDMEKTEVNVFLPKFEMTTEYRLNDMLMELGMVDAFMMGAADLSGINGGVEPLVISDVLHKAFVKVDEEGTEAAAATAVVIRNYSGGGDDAITFRADHPFMFFIMHEPTGSILFMGKVEDPSG